MFLDDEALKQRLQQRYGHRLAAKPESEKAYRCMCCRDNAIIPADVIRRYVDPGYDLLINGEPGYFCQAPHCTANNIQVDAEGQTKSLSRYDIDGLDLSLKSQECDHIHHSEVERYRAEGNAIQPPFNVDQVLETVVKPMPKPSKAEQLLEEKLNNVSEEWS